MIRVETIYAHDEDELARRLNDLEGRIITVESLGNDEFRVIYEDEN